MFSELPAEVQRQARRAYRIFQQNPNHPSLRFKPVHPTRPIYSARISPDYRPVGVFERDEIVWYRVGSHSEMTSFLLSPGVSPNYRVEKDPADRASHPIR